jgi:nucleoside-diphosphate-sugar epimerase
MHVLVTGANGFIGQHLVRALLDAGHHVRGMYNVEKPLYFFGSDEIEWRKAELRDPKSLQGIGKDIDLVFHLAAIPRNDKSKTWDDFLTQNVKGTELLLQECDSSKVKRFVYVSSVEAAGYGDGIHPRSEEDPTHPENDYGKSKKLAEELVLGKQWSMECVVVRLPMIYGPGTFLIVPKLFGFVKNGFYPLIGTSPTLMEFCYVGNAVSALLLVSQSKEAVGELFYVSDKRSYSIREVVSQVAKAMNVKILFVSIPVFLAMFGALLFEGMARLLPFPPLVSRYSRKPFFTRETVMWTTKNCNIVSTEKIKRVLGYTPTIDIAEGCRRTAEWLRAHWSEQQM